MFSLLPARTIVLEAFGFTVYWYGLLYVLSFALAYLLLPRLARERGINLTREVRLSLLTAVLAGVIIGGRVGYVLFYEPQYFLAHPAAIFFLWQGGMASHGGFIGAGLALWLWSRRYAISFYHLLDIVVVPAALGLALGRLGNFMNQELPGTASSLPWAISFPDLPGLHHPWSLYAMLQNAALAGVCWWFLSRRPAKPGQTTALFLALYSISRLLLDELRLSDGLGIAIGSFTLSRQQLLTLPLLVVAGYLWYQSRQHEALPHP